MRGAVGVTMTIHVFSALREWQLLLIPKICGHYMCTFPDVKTSLFLPRPSSPPSCSPRATAKSSDITRMFQRLEGEREGGREGRTSAQPRTHAQVGRSLGMRRIPATCGKKITFPVSLLAQEETRRRQRPKQAAAQGKLTQQPAFFYFSQCDR